MQFQIPPKKSKFGSVTEFPLSSEQCETLCALEQCETVAGLAVALRRDASAVSRQLQKIANAAPVLEKVQGRWKLTPLGREVVQWSRHASNSLNRLFKRKQALRVGTTREFAARVLCPQIPAFIESVLPGAELLLLTHEDGVEEMLLKGEVDFGIDCGRPRDPMVRFKMIAPEPMGIYGSTKLFGKKPPRDLKELFQWPNLQYRRLSTSRSMKLNSEPPLVAGFFNDTASIREACAAGLGWAILPEYAARREVEQDALVRLDIHPIPAEKFGIWWLRGSPLSATVEAAERWLSTQML